MRFTFLAAAIAAVSARVYDESNEFVDLEDVNPHKASYYRRVKDPFVRARYKYAMDKCKGQLNAKKRYKCFKRNWNLYKPHRQNNLNDLRSRTARACWRYKNNILKRAKCFAKYTRDYKGALYKGLLADDDAANKEPKTQKTDQKPKAALAEAEDEGEEEHDEQWPYVPGNTQSTTDSE